MYIIDKNMGGTGGQGGSVSRWNFEGNYKNATLQVLGKKNQAQPSNYKFKTKKKHIHFGSD